MSFISLILGTVSIIFSVYFNFYAWYITLLTSAIGIIFGLVARRSSFRSVANAGIILSVIGIVITLIMLVAFSFIANVFTGTAV